jgi:peptidyl-prolyl cis-trans isomerase A (cyclophilin A)
MNLLSRRSFCGWLMAASLAGCSQPMPSDPPLPMGPPLEKSAAASVDFGDTPEVFQVKFETTKGDVVIEVHRDWSPHGAARFYELVKAGFYDDCRFFRVIPGFMVQCGINGDPKIMDKWRDANIPDDRPSGANRQSNTRGMVTFAKSSLPNSRSTQIFFNYADNSRLDADGFTPFAKVLSGMDVLESLNPKYGEEASNQQGRIQHEGNAFLDREFPGLDSIKTARLVDSAAATSSERPKAADADKSTGTSEAAESTQ